MAKRGFFAELRHQNQLAAKRQLQAERESVRATAAAQRRAEQARGQSERARAQLARASAAQQKASESEAKRLHEESRLAEVASLNAQLAATYDEIDSILSATLAVDDYVDLEQLRVVVEHPPFTHTDLEVLTPSPVRIATPPEPEIVEPEAPKGLAGVFGGKKKHAEALAAARAAFSVTHQAWQATADAVPARQRQQAQERRGAEAQRLTRLKQARRVYRRECAERDVQAASTNQALDELIRGVQAGADSAIQEYVGIVLGNSVYPESLCVAHDFEFDSELRELVLTALVSPPAGLPSTKEYKFVKAKDEIVATALPKKDLKDRYANAVYQVALRTLHEVFEADRAAHINTIALTVATDAIDPATGLNKQTRLVAVGAERRSFVTFDLSNIVPLATLQHLGASVSKNPYDLRGIDDLPGVRGR
ncbi:MAG: restriction system protein [Solirubrobacteraceae bacterium]|jgi:restriction system protein|nr:restriction system protein [Solirubrobacteraceae bacterium]